MEKEQVKAALLKHAEIFAEGIVADLYDPALDAAKEALKKAIPGQVDDAVIELVIGSLKPIFKAELLKQVEKISAEV
jgi:hypothetical protein